MAGLLFAEVRIICSWASEAGGRKGGRTGPSEMALSEREMESSRLDNKIGDCVAELGETGDISGGIEPLAK